MASRYLAEDVAKLVTGDEDYEPEIFMDGSDDDLELDLSSDDVVDFALNLRDDC